VKRRQFLVLYRDFLRRLVDVQMLSAHARGDASTLFGQFASLLIFLSVLFSLPALYFDGKMAVPGQQFVLLVWTLQHFLIATTMLLVGIFAVLTWNSVFPDRQDAMILAPLPVRTRTVFLAKIAAVGTGPALLVITLHVLAGLVWPLAFNRHVSAQVLPDFVSQLAMPPVSAAAMRSVLDSDIEPLRRSGAFVHGGVSIGVVTHGEQRIFSYGTAKPDSIFEIGSVTKTFTALALAQMTQQRLVKLNEPVRDLLPRRTVEKPDGPEITLLDLATHHSGLPRMPAGFYQKNKDDPFADFHAADLYDYMATHGVKKPADVSFQYSNLALGLLGQVLADRAHMSYADLIKTEVTGPLALPDTVVLLSPEQRRRLIQGYNGFGAGPDGFRRASHAYGDPVPPTTFDAIAGAGALHSTAGDLLRFLEENLHPETHGNALSAALRASQQPRAPMDDSAESAQLIPAGTRVALIWWQTPDGCYIHGGAMPGYSASVLFHPKQDWGIAVLSNVGPGGLISSDLIAEHIRQRLEGLPALALAPVSIPATGGFLGLFRIFAAYWLTIIAAGTFTYCAVLALQGLIAELLPRQWFLRVSSFVQIAVFCAVVSGYFLQPAIAAPNLLNPHSTGPPEWSPSYWFLGFLQQLNGSHALGSYAQRAWLGLAVAFTATVVTYTLCYLRLLRKIVEQPDILPGARRSGWLPRFGTSFESAITQFAVRTLLRSRQHRVLLAFYLGIGFGATVLLLKSPVAKQISMIAIVDPLRQVSDPLLAATIIFMGFAVVGMRVVFSLPLEVSANWIFRVTPVRAGRHCLQAVRQSLWLLAVSPAWLLSAGALSLFWPWRPALKHLFLLLLIGLTITELCLTGNQKIPFTCRWLPGKSNLHISFWLCIMLVLQITLIAADFERSSLESPRRYAAIAGVLLAAAIFCAIRNSRSGAQESDTLQFERQPSWQLTTLDLPR
jgi:CubicO group peptidase (beta-lactamase class C family)